MGLKGFHAPDPKWLSGSQPGAEPTLFSLTAGRHRATLIAVSLYRLPRPSLRNLSRLLSQPLAFAAPGGGPVLPHREGLAAGNCPPLGVSAGTGRVRARSIWATSPQPVRAPVPPGGWHGPLPAAAGARRTSALARTREQLSLWASTVPQLLL
jgi:hypothetical protein